MHFQPYTEQLPLWPQSGRHIMAQFDDDSIYVYQAYRPSIAKFAVEHQRFGGDFSFSRMSWIKPNFLWMMYRAGWASKEGQEHILAVRLRRRFFDELLRQVVPSTFDPVRFASREAWQASVASSDVRLQWDPDHDPSGKPVQRRAVQLGLRGDALRRYGEKELISVDDITAFVVEQRDHLGDCFRQLITPEERVYIPQDQAAIDAVGIDHNEKTGEQAASSNN
jgi:Domain of unknown function (DUF4291)